MSTYGHEKGFFFDRLIADIYFLLKHFSWLFHSIITKIVTRLRIVIRSSNRGAKIFPKDLFKKRILSCPAGGELFFYKNLPQYPFKGKLSNSQKIELSNKNISLAGDAESIFAAHRWAYLLDHNNFMNYDLAAKLRTIEVWIKCNPDKNEPVWEIYSSCERIANSLVYFSILPRDCLENIDFTKYVDFLSSSVEWIYLNLEYYGEKRTNNHILNNARALVMAGVALGSEEAIDSGMKIFRTYLPKLISNKGFLRERSSHYQLIVLNWLMDAFKFIESNKISDKKDIYLLKKYIDKMVSASRLITSSDGVLLSTIGDVSPDCSPSQSSIRMNWLYPDLWQKKLSSVSICEIQDDWFRLNYEEDLILGNFIAGKFPPEFPTHGHNDFTSFIWNSNKKRILIDPGRFRYTADSISISQVSSMGHNLPIINGFAPFCETLKPGGYLWPIPYAVAHGEMFAVKDAIILSHDGFSRSTPVQTHARQIKLLKESLEVTDAFSGNGEVDVLLNWHFDGDYQAFDKNALAMISSENSIAITLYDSKNQKPIVPIACNALQLSQSIVYGEKSDYLCLQIRLTMQLPSKITSNFKIRKCVE